LPGKFVLVSIRPAGWAIRQPQWAALWWRKGRHGGLPYEGGTAVPSGACLRAGRVVSYPTCRRDLPVPIVREWPFECLRVLSEVEGELAPTDNDGQGNSEARINTDG